MDHFDKKKTCSLIWNSKKYNRKWNSDIKVAGGNHLKNERCVLIGNGEKCKKQAVSAGPLDLVCSQKSRENVRFDKKKTLYSRYRNIYKHIFQSKIHDRYAFNVVTVYSQLVSENIILIVKKQMTPTSLFIILMALYFIYVQRTLTLNILNQYCSQVHGSLRDRALCGMSYFNYRLRIDGKKKQ
jgi:hypothetical protein